MFVGYWPVGFPHFLPTTAVIPKGVSSSKKTSKHVRLLIVIRLYVVLVAALLPLRGSGGWLRLSQRPLSAHMTPEITHRQLG